MAIKLGYRCGIIDNLIRVIGLKVQADYVGRVKRLFNRNSFVKMQYLPCAMEAVQISAMMEKEYTICF